MTRRRVEDAVETPVKTPDGVPIEDLPGWDAERGVFVLDRSRTTGAKRRARPRERHVRERVEPEPAHRR